MILTFCYPDNKQKIRGVTSTRLAKSQQFVNDLFSDENGRVKDLDEKLDAMIRGVTSTRLLRLGRI
jgi:hypothetical protein